MPSKKYKTPSMQPSAESEEEAEEIQVEDILEEEEAVVDLPPEAQEELNKFLEDRLRRRYSALDRPANLPCYSETRIDWTEDRRGRIVLIQAARHPCS